MSSQHPEIHLGGTARTPEDVVSLHRLGLQFAEVPIKDPKRFMNDLDRYRIVSDETGLYYLCHGPREGDPNNLETLENVYFPKLVGVMALMPKLNMRLLTVHLWMDPRFLKPETIEYKIDFLKRLLEIGQQAKITICLENLSESSNHMAPVFAALPELNMTLDLGHAELLSNHNTAFGFLQQYPERIQHMHLHDNRGGNSPDDDLHLPLGRGIIDFKAIFEAVKAADYSGTITLELRPDEIEQCLGYVKKLLGQ